MAILNVADYGATGTGGDDTAAIEACCFAAVPGDVIQFGPGRFGISRTIAPPCRIIGGSAHHSVLVALPGSVQPMISFYDRSGVGAIDLGFEGNGEYSGGYPAAIQFGGMTVETRGFVLRRCAFRNFKADYWVLGASYVTSFDTLIEDNRFNSKPGDGPVYADGSPNGGQFVTMYGTDTGAFANTKIFGNTADGAGVAQGFSLFGLHRDFDISGNQIYSMGQATTSRQNSYAILVYGATDSHAPAFGNINNNIIQSPASCGIYCATGSDFNVNSNYIYGQSRVDNATLPRAGISLNGVSNVAAVGNSLQNCKFGFALAGSVLGNIMVASNRIMSSSNDVGMQLNATLGGAARVAVTNNDVWISGNGGVAFQNAMSGGNIIIRNNASRASAHGLIDTHTAISEIGENTFFPL